MKKLLFILLISYTQLSLAYFYPENYTQSRDEFKKTVNELKSNLSPELSQISLRVPSDTDVKLTIDGVYLPQNGGSKDRLLIITSGIHGVETFTGAAIQIEYLKNYLDPAILNSMGILVLHSINPYGFHFLRRVDEDNIDLNRNFSATHEHFNTKLAGYESFEDYVNPQKPLSAGLWSDLKLFIKSLFKLIRYGKKQIAQIAVGGQYQNPKGIYFGGHSLQPNASLTKQVFRQIGKDYSKVFHIDLHTGYGERGRLHFFSSKLVTQLNGFNEIFKGFDIDVGADKNFYTTSGDFVTFTLQTFAEKEFVIPMTFEFGTMDSQTILGGFYSLRNLIYENQGFHYGYGSTASEKRAKTDFLNMFNPSDQKWRDKVLKDGTATLKTVIRRFSEI